MARQKARTTARPTRVSARRSRAWRALGTTALATVAITVFGGGTAYAVHDLAFQLDGDVAAATTTSVGGHTQGSDWDSLFTSAGVNKSPLPADFTAAKFSRDFQSSGSKIGRASVGKECRSRWSPYH